MCRVGLSQIGQDFMEQNHDRFFGRLSRERVGNRISPELHAHHTDRRIRDELGKSHQLEVEGAQGIVSILTALWQGVADQVGIVV
jgi:hypothetical protein